MQSNGKPSRRRKKRFDPRNLLGENGLNGSKFIIYFNINLILKPTQKKIMNK